MGAFDSDHVNCACRRNIVTGRLPKPCPVAEWRKRMLVFRNAVRAGFYTDEIQETVDNQEKGRV